MGIFGNRYWEKEKDCPPFWEKEKDCPPFWEKEKDCPPFWEKEYEENEAKCIHCDNNEFIIYYGCYKVFGKCTHCGTIQSIFS